MYDINDRQSGPGIAILIFVFSIGLMASFSFVYLFYNTIKMPSEYDANTVSIGVTLEKEYNDEGEEMMRQIFTYVVDGKEYTCRGWAANYELQAKNDIVYYQSNNPSNCKIKEPQIVHTFFWIMMIVPILVMAFPVCIFIKNHKRLKPARELNKKGKLVKNIPCHIVPSEFTINGDKIPCLVVDYILPNGMTVTLRGTPRFDFEVSDDGNYIDLLIDEDNPTNYIIDYNINRKSGNLPTDYYKGNMRNGEEDEI